jgi:tetratricopeptide (TPR) repeat protein
MSDRAADAPRYTAFLSYSHKDAAEAARIHRRLESYRLPKRLVGRETDRGQVPPRLCPIFRDREEMAAATDLSETVRAALAESAALIVLCSPDAAASLWVSEEIATFRRLYPDRPVLAAILVGEPPACFPAAMRSQDADGTWHEPLATDLRRQGDGPHLGLLKLVAGITGVALDDLVQRDASRRIRRVTAVTAGALTAVLIMAALTVVALGARREADRQRAEAKGLSEFMLTDLRERLREVGRLDVMEQTNRRALEFYDRQSELPPRDAAMRARVLHAIGEDNLARGNREAAVARFREALRATDALIRRHPDDPDVIYAHAQSEYWLGYAAYVRQDLVSARAAWQRYRDRAEQLASRDPRNPDWIREAGYAAGNLCTLTLEQPPDGAAAVRFCSAALERMERAHSLMGDDAGILVDLANRHGWLVNAWAVNGRWDRARHHQAQHEAIIRALIVSHPDNMDYRDIWMRAQYGFAERLLARNEVSEAATRLADAADTAESLHTRDPTNASWRRWRQRIQRKQQEASNVRTSESSVR